MKSSDVIVVHDMKRFFESKGIKVVMDYVSGGTYKFILRKYGIAKAYYFHDPEANPATFDSDRCHRARINACENILQAFDEYIASQIRIGVDDLKKVTDVVGDIKKAQLNALYGRGAFDTGWMKPVFEKEKFVIFPTTTDTTKEKEKVMNKQFTKKDLKVGYVVKTRARGLYMVAVNANEELVMANTSQGWMPLHGYNDDLTDSGRTSLFVGTANENYDIVEVYGYSRNNCTTVSVSTENRTLLWKREEPKEMTLEEIEKALGYPVKIVNK